MKTKNINHTGILILLILGFFLLTGCTFGKGGQDLVAQGKNPGASAEKEWVYDKPEDFFILIPQEEEIMSHPIAANTVLGKIRKSSATYKISFRIQPNPKSPFKLEHNNYNVKIWLRLRTRVTAYGFGGATTNEVYESKKTLFLDKSKNWTNTEEATFKNVLQVHKDPTLNRELTKASLEVALLFDET